jgi:hypothetical protein
VGLGDVPNDREPRPCRRCRGHALIDPVETLEDPLEVAAGTPIPLSVTDTAIRRFE